jgi:hypothetical protein
VERKTLPPISKLEAARRQVDFAIEQHFAEADPFAIHTIICAALGILQALAERSGTVRIHQATKDVIVPGKEAEFRRYMNRASNFLKHADRDPDERLADIAEDVNGPTIFVATCYYADLAREVSAPMSVYMHWFSALNPRVLTEEARAEAQARVRKEDLEAMLAQPRHIKLRAGKALLREKLDKGILKLPFS